MHGALTSDVNPIPSQPALRGGVGFLSSRTVKDHHVNLFWIVTHSGAWLWQKMSKVKLLALLVFSWLFPSDPSLLPTRSPPEQNPVAFKGGVRMHPGFCLLSRCHYYGRPFDSQCPSADRELSAAQQGSLVFLTSLECKPKSHVSDSLCNSGQSLSF